MDGQQLKSNEEKIAHISNLGYSNVISNAEGIAKFLDDDD